MLIPLYQLSQSPFQNALNSLHYEHASQLALRFSCDYLFSYFHHWCNTRGLLVAGLVAGRRRVWKFRRTAHALGCRQKESNGKCCVICQRLVICISKFDFLKMKFTFIDPSYSTFIFFYSLCWIPVWSIFLHCFCFEPFQKRVVRCPIAMWLMQALNQINSLISFHTGLCKKI